MKAFFRKNTYICVTCFVTYVTSLGKGEGKWIFKVSIGNEMKMFFEPVYNLDIKKGYLSQTANLFVNLKSNTMKNTLQRYGLSGYLQILREKQAVL